MLPELKHRKLTTVRAAIAAIKAVIGLITTAA
jgi:hypothetical protein